MNFKLIYWYWLSIMLLVACVPPKEETLTDVRIDFQNDKLLQKVYDFQDRLLVDSLLPFFQHPDPSYRYAAAMAFASVKDKSALDGLAGLLNDDIEKVRIAAAYAIGQLGQQNEEALLINAYNRGDSAMVDQRFNATILEAVGKCASPNYLNALSTITTFTRLDTLLLEGQAWGIYRYALRGITSPEGTRQMINFLTKSRYPNSVRFIAANYLFRAKDIKLDFFAESLSKLISLEADPRIRMALAIGLGKTHSDVSYDSLLSWFGQEKDYRVKCNIIKALGNFDYERVRPTILASLNNPQLPIAETAAQFLIDHGNARDATYYWRLAKGSLPWQVQAKLYGAANKHLPGSYNEFKQTINSELNRRFQTSTNAYEKAAILKALGNYHWNYRNIHDIGYTSNDPIVRTASVEALANIARNPQFVQKFRGNAPAIKLALRDYFIEAINKSDIAMAAIAANVLRTPGLDFDQLIENKDFLDVALNKLTLPKDYETYIELQKTINFFQTGKEGDIPPPQHTHPIDWRRVKAITENTQAIIETNKGNIVLRFFPMLAPATIANFIQLSKENFFQNKYFHRVIPNFVVQTGCPRGDGYGSLNYSIRSELPPAHFDAEGFVGMASAGNHTESTQWFITHSPAPHLDGNYTLFAKVEKGMEIVHKIEQGDIIKKVIIEN